MSYRPSKSEGIEFEHSRSLKVKSDGAVGLIKICYFLSVPNSNIWPNWASLRDASLHNVSHLDFDLSRSLKLSSM